MATTIIEGEVSEANCGRIDLFVRTLIELSRRKLKGLFDHGCVSLNGKPCDNPATRVDAGDRVTIHYDPHQGYSEKKRPWSDRTFVVIHEDEQLLVVNKAAGVLTVPTNQKETNSLHERITAYLSRKKKNHEARLIHRLDRGASGVMVFAKTPAAATELRQQFNSDSPIIKFVAIVSGVVMRDTATIESYLDTHANLNRFSTTDQKRGQHAITKYTVIKRLDNATVVELDLVTARRHQARFQLSDAGHPVLGDMRYGDKQHRHERWSRKRLAMHSVSLSLTHPATGQTVTYACELPAPFKKFMRHKV